MRKSKAFTLVELLVVIGIIALLISILLPSLQKARDSAVTVQCLSNLRQVGMGLTQYSLAHKGAMPPCEIYGYHNGLATGTDNGRFWFNILGDNDYVAVNDSSTGNVMMCPGAIDQEAAWNTASPWWTAPESMRDGKGEWYMRTESATRSPSGGTQYHRTNYAINAIWSGIAYWDTTTAPNPQKLATAHWVPSYMGYGKGAAQGDIDNSGRGYPMNTTKVKDNTRMVIAFDGRWLLAFNPRQINLRHGGRQGRRTMTNMLFLDGHAETLQEKQLPKDADNLWDFNTLNFNGWGFKYVNSPIKNPWG